MIGRRINNRRKTKIKLIYDVPHKLVYHLGLPNDLVNQLTGETMKLDAI